MIGISLQRVTTSRFPGEGRGPVAEHGLAVAVHRYCKLRDWAPAFAGEAYRGGAQVVSG